MLRRTETSYSEMSQSELVQVVDCEKRHMALSTLLRIRVLLMFSSDLLVSKKASHEPRPRCIPMDIAVTQGTPFDTA